MFSGGFAGNLIKYVVGVDAMQGSLSLRRFTGSAHNAGRATEHFERTTKNLTRSLGFLGGALGIRQLIEYADTWTLISARIGLVTDSTEQMMAVQSRVFEIAQRTRNTLAATSVLYTRVALNADQLGRSHEDLLQVTEAVNAAMLISGATGVEAAQAMRQFAQALGSGRVQGDEFRTMMEAMPMVARAISDEMGVALGDLYRLSKQGAIDVQTVIDALLNKHDELLERSENMPWTVGQAWEIFTNALSRTVGIMNMAFGTTDMLAKAIITLSRNMDRVIGLFGGLIAAVAAYRVQAMVATGAQMIAGWIRMARALRTAADAQAILNALTGGFLKLAVTAVAVTAGLIAYEEIQRRIARETEKWTESLSDLTGALGETFDRIDEIDAARAKNSDMIREAAQEIVLSAMESEAAERHRIVFDAVNKRIEAERELNGVILKERLGAIDIEERYLLLANDIRNDIERFQKALEEYDRIIQRFARSLQRQMARTFRNIFQDGIESFGDFVNALKDMFFTLMSEMLAAKFMQSFGDELSRSLNNTFGASEEMKIKAARARLQSDKAGGYFSEAMGEPVPKEHAVHLKSMDPEAERSWTSTLVKYLAPALAGFAAGQAIGSMTTNTGLGALGGGLSGAATGFMIGGPVGAAIGGLTGAIGGLTSAMSNAAREAEARRRLLEEQNRLIAENSVSLQDLRDEFAGVANRDFKEFYNSQLWSAIQRSEQNKPYAFYKPQLSEGYIAQLAAELGITFFDSQGKVLLSAIHDFVEAVELSVRMLTEFGASVDEMTRKQNYYNKIFDVEESPGQALSDTYDILSQAAPDLMRQLGLANLDLTSEIGRATLEEGLKDIFRLVESGGLDLDLLGAFTDKNQLLDAIVRVKDALNELHKQLYDVTTDFPRAMDIIYYEKLFGSYGTNEEIVPPQSSPPTRPFDGVLTEYVPVGNPIVNWNVDTIVIEAGEGTDGEELLTKMERAAYARRNRGGRINLGLDSEVF